MKFSLLVGGVLLALSGAAQAKCVGSSICFHPLAASYIVIQVADAAAASRDEFTDTSPIQPPLLGSLTDVYKLEQPKARHGAFASWGDPLKFEGFSEARFANFESFNSASFAPFG